MRCTNPLLSPNNFTQGHLTKIERLVTDVKAIRSPDRAKCAILEMILGDFWLIQAVFVAGQPLCDLGFFGPIWEMFLIAGPFCDVGTSY